MEGEAYPCAESACLRASLFWNHSFSVVCIANIQDWKMRADTGVGSSVSTARPLQLASLVAYTHAHKAKPWSMRAAKWALQQARKDHHSGRAECQIFSL